MSQTQTRQSLEQRSINAIRALTIDALGAAGSGHPGMPLGAAPMGYTLFTKFMKFNPANDRWIDRDRYIQSAGARVDAAVQPRAPRRLRPADGGA